MITKNLLSSVFICSIICRFISKYTIKDKKIGDTTMKIIDHEIKRYVIRVKEFKEKSENLIKLKGSEGYEAAAEELRKDEKNYQ